MKECFVSTPSFQRLDELFKDLASNRFGVELAEIIGPAGRGKTWAAMRIATQNRNAVFVRYDDLMSPFDLFREIAFALSGARPTRSRACFEAIRESCRQLSPVVFVDEADRMSLKYLNLLRDIHDVCGTPVVLIGEEPLHEKINRERRLSSRIRKRISFAPVGQVELNVYYRQALDLSVDPVHAARLVRHAKGDFRLLAADAKEAEYLMSVNGLKALTDRVIDEVVKDK